VKGDIMGAQTLEEIEAEIERVRAERAERERSASLAAAMERAQQTLADEAAWDAAVAEYGVSKLARVETDNGMLILKRPNPVKYKAFQDKPGINVDQIQELVSPCIVYPPKPVVNAWIAEQPGMLNELGRVVAKLAGARAAEVTAK
jgi:hypothetical protein